MPETSQNPKKGGLDKWQMASMAMELGFIIALPLIALGFLGKWLDAKYDTKPWFTLGGIVLAITATTWWLTIKIKSLIPK
ncbi:MAG: AtpZ/AtpI family protein [Acidobacteriaceae bacterium]